MTSSTAGRKKPRRRKLRFAPVARRRSPRCRRAIAPVARSRGRASPTTARSAPAARSTAAFAASRSATSWRELPRRAPPQTVAVRRGLQANQRRSVTCLRLSQYVRRRIQESAESRGKSGVLALQAQRFCANRFLRPAAPVEPTSGAARPRRSAAKRTALSPDAWRKDTGPSRPRSKSSRSRRACCGIRMPLPNRDRRATSAPHRRPTRRSRAACPRACKPGRPSRPVRTGASSDAQRQQNATERLGVYVSVERYLGAVRQADLHRAAPLASASRTSPLRCDIGMRRRRGRVQLKQLHRDKGRSAPLRWSGHDRLLLRRLAPPIAPPPARAPYPLENEIGVQPVPTRDRRYRDARRKSLLDDPLALVEASRSPPLPSSVLRRHLVSTSDSGGHLIQSRRCPTGGRQITLTSLSDDWTVLSLPTIAEIDE